MKLVQDKKINLHEDIKHYLKRWKFPYDTVSHGKPITPAHLLTHTAGLTVHGFDGYSFGDTLPTILQTLNGEPPPNNLPVRSQFEPGTKFEYSGGGITVSELMLQDITASDYNKFMRSEILRRIRMSRTFFTTDPPDSNFATGYRSDEKDMGRKIYAL
jgi:CubicO group peptidase (beta-lactamase class C family)